MNQKLLDILHRVAKIKNYRGYRSYSDFAAMFLDVGMQHRWIRSEEHKTKLLNDLKNQLETKGMELYYFVAAKPFHNTEKILVGGKECDIDVGIVPVVRWINSFDGLRTIACCHGEGTLVEPYLVYVYDGRSHIVEINRTIRTFAWAVKNDFQGVKRYWIRFHSPQHLQQFCELLKAVLMEAL